MNEQDQNQEYLACLSSFKLYYGNEPDKALFPRYREYWLVEFEKWSQAWVSGADYVAKRIDKKLEKLSG